MRERRWKGASAVISSHETIGHEYQLLPSGQGGISQFRPKYQPCKARQEEASASIPQPPSLPPPNSHNLYTMVVTTIYVTRHGVSHPLALPGIPLDIPPSHRHHIVPGQLDHRSANGHLCNHHPQSHRHTIRPSPSRLWSSSIAAISHRTF